MALTHAIGSSSQGTPMRKVQRRAKRWGSRGAVVPTHPVHNRRRGMSVERMAMATHSMKPTRLARRTRRVRCVNPGKELPGSYVDRPAAPKGRRRRAGVLLHPTSLPGEGGIGTVGSQARRFVDFLSSAGMSAWQMLPLVPPDADFHSPYSGEDANCGNVMLIDLASLVDVGLLEAKEVDKALKQWNWQWKAAKKADFEGAEKAKRPLLEKAARNLREGKGMKQLLEKFKAFRAREDISPWLEESALFSALKGREELKDLFWWEWPEELRDRHPEALKRARVEEAEAIDQFVSLQFLFDMQWQNLKMYANENGIALVGDMPIYVGGHSADVWANRGLWELREDGTPAQVSGVPPDAFSKTGQLWGSPLYHWPSHEEEGYRWWAQRLGRALQLYDELRIDHFRGFAGYWAVDADQETAMVGTWRAGPGKSLFDSLKEQLGGFNIIAEDLGVITQDVVDLREAIEAPGMAVLQFAWGGSASNPHLSHNHYENCVVYPATHDNETTVGWFKRIPAEEKGKVLAYLGTNGKDIAWDFIRASMSSVADTSIFLMQDVMRLDNSARMNTPGVAEGNWAWRMGNEKVWKKLKQQAEELRTLAEITGRIPSG